MTYPGGRPVPVWKRSTLGFLVPVVGLTAFPIAVLIFTVVLGGIEYLPAVLFSAILGPAFAGISLVGWVSGRWVRREVARGRSEGKAVWPVRAESDGRPRVRLAVLEASEDGLAVMIDLGVVRVPWEDVTTIELIDRGALKGSVIVVDGLHSGRVELEILKSNAVARVDAEGRTECLALLKYLRSESLKLQGGRGDR